MVNPNDPLYPVFLRVLKKQTKPHRILNDSSFTGNSLSIGNPGSGKTSGNRRECELRYNRGDKLFLLYDAGRTDMMYMMLPSDENFWKVPKIDGRKIICKRGYPTLLAYPISKNIPEKLPKSGIPFTIPVNSLTEDDIAALVGGSSRDTIKGIFYYMQNHVDENTTAEDYVNIMGAALKKVEDTDGIKPSHFGVKKLKSDFFLPLLNEGLLSSGKASTCLDIREHIKDKKTIFVLVLKHIPKTLWGFLVHYIMNHISIELGGFGNSKPIKQKTTIVLNEVADLLSSDEDIGSSSYAINKMIAKILKQSRTFNIFLLMDTQLPQELPAVKDTLQRVYIYNSSLSSIEKAMEIIGISTRSGEIGQDDFMIIPRLEKGWYYLFDRDSGVSIHKLTWCRSRTWKDGENFYDIYDKVYGKGAYYSIKDKLLELEQEKTKSQAAWELRREIAKNNIINHKTLNKRGRAKKIAEDFDEETDNEEKFEEQIEENLNDINEIEIKVKNEDFHVIDNSQNTIIAPEIIEKEIITSTIEEPEQVDYASYKKIIKTL